MLDVMYDVPSKEGLSDYTVTAEMVKNRNNAELIQLPTKKELTNEEIA